MPQNWKHFLSSEHLHKLQRHQKWWQTTTFTSGWQTERCGWSTDSYIQCSGSPSSDSGHRLLKTTHWKTGHPSGSWNHNNTVKVGWKPFTLSSYLRDAMYNVRVVWRGDPVLRQRSFHVIRNNRGKSRVTRRILFWEQEGQKLGIKSHNQIQSQENLFFRLSAQFAVLSPHLVVALAPAEVLPSCTPTETLWHDPGLMPRTPETSPIKKWAQSFCVFMLTDDECVRYLLVHL